MLQGEGRVLIQQLTRGNEMPPDYLRHFLGKDPELRANLCIQVCIQHAVR